MINTTRSIDTLILGAGLAGLSAAYHLGSSAEIYEAEGYVGGKARSESYDGFTFDVTGHWLHFRNDSSFREELPKRVEPLPFDQQNYP